MMNAGRRSFLKALAAIGAGSVVSAPLFRAVAGPSAASDEFFIFIHALGGWDVTLCTDPRWEEAGLVNPASTLNSDITAIRNWTNGAAALSDGSFSFQPIRPDGTPFVLGPTIGNMLKHVSRMTLINGISTNTVSHPDGQTYAVTGRHLNGGRPNQSSIDCCVANELGTEMLLPVVSVQFPSYSLGSQMDARVTPLRISSIGTVAKSLSRPTLYDTADERRNVGIVLSEEAKDLAAISNDPSAYQSLALQYQGLQNMLAKDMQNMFSATALTASHPEMNIAQLKFQGPSAINAAFAIEAFKSNVARCVSFIFNGFDTHFGNYRGQALTQQEMFDTIAALIDQLDAIPHPNKPGSKLSEHTHILLTSDFCRTPQINLGKGRDHYPNGSAIVISPKWKGNTVFGSTDHEQLLPANAGTFSDGARPITPPDVLSTFVGAFGVDPKKYFREGDIVKGLLA
jgi:uncharacterized protein (DUF1501 family)